MDEIKNANNLKQIIIYFCKNESKEEIKNIEYCVSKHLLTFSSYKEYIAEMRRLNVGKYAKPIRSACQANSLMCFNYKMALITSLYNRQVSKNIFINYKVSPKRYIVNRLLNDPNISLWEEKIDKAECMLNNLQEYEKHCSKLIENLQVYTRRFVYMKLRFIMFSNSLEIEDITNDLLAKATEAYYASIPFKPELHILNIMKRAIHNEGINLINYYGAAKRQRLMINPENTSNILTNRIISLHLTDQSHEMHGSEVPEFLFNLAEEDQNRENMEIDYDINKIKSGLIKPSHVKAVSLLAMEDDPEFSKSASKIVRNVAKKDSESIYRLVGPKMYRKLVRKYLGIKRDEMALLVNSIQKQLGRGI
jgi:hypothetical protein